MARHRSGRGVVWGALFVALLFGGARIASADVKLAFIDSDRIFAEYEKTREAQAAFNREVQELSRTAQDQKSEIDKMQKRLDQQSPMLSEAKKDQESQALQQKVSDYEAFIQKNWGPGGAISKLNEEYLRPIIDRVHSIVADIGNNEGYQLILDAADGNIVYGDQSLDLTNRVLSRLRDEDSGKVSPPSGTTTGGP
ncbi:MAG TPA: OmpH family outer membrane protein [Candidatus Eisenbacteria bacterium]|nr:OmpH family outer membrane protein [Candidatus Eisenbacteria bacterium]